MQSQTRTKSRTVLLVLLVMLAPLCLAAAIVWSPRCSSSPSAQIGGAMLVAGCEQR
ncbi:MULTISPECIES: hypothetical protein [unclassified Bradyrhizobium]|uniref:hypothetical protein n=1 Tax=unclassified Bradyrhizobium TaxID=2631580 RepID=UPI0028F02ED5|nr:MULTISPECIES: hypothetical protein [unclassified Bradyrhizobium]